MSEETDDNIEDISVEHEASDDEATGAGGEEVAEVAQNAGFVAIVGQPNVGKSTLLNQILGVKVAIATHRPQTTRNRILGVKTLPGRGQLAFIDTPGIHTSTKRLNRAIVRFATESLQDVDAVLHLVDAQDQTPRAGSGLERPRGGGPRRRLGATPWRSARWRD
ncbi:MAG: GTPase [Myxococcota bacterium]